MIHPEITSLFKYCPIGKNQLSALAQQKIWYSKPAEFNDPFDTKFRVRGKKYAFKQGLRNFEKGIEKLGILSLASSNKNLLMWSHYASEHKGMCLEFQRIFSTALADDKKTKPMNYNDNYPSIQVNSILNEVDTLSNKIRILHSKSKHWEYEKEWRHIVEQGNELHPWPAALTSVYFGCKANISDIHLVKSIIADSNVKYYKGNLYSDRFDIYFKPI